MRPTLDHTDDLRSRRPISEADVESSCPPSHRIGDNPEMPTTTSLAAFTALAFALIVVPGPSVMFVISRAVALGRRAAITTVLGNAAGVYVQVVFVAVGLGAIVARSIAVFTAIKFIGAGYLVWLGIQAIRRRHQLVDTLTESDKPVRLPRSVFRDGFIVGIANPKAIVFFAAILPQYVNRDGAPAQLQMLALGLIFVVVALLSDGAWGLAAGTARGWFARSPERLNRLGAIGGTAMIGLGLQLAVTQRKD
jgi:threonine/homoserine/homoserine lactone efflux protein